MVYVRHINLYRSSHQGTATRKTEIEIKGEVISRRGCSICSSRASLFTSLIRCFKDKCCEAAPSEKHHSNGGWGGVGWGGVGWGWGGPLLSAIWANGRSLCQHGSHRRKRAQGHGRKLRRQTEGAFADTGHSFSVKEPLSNTCAPTPLCPTSDILSESPCSAELQAPNKRLCRLGRVRAGE